ncbi:lytic murein transglycosylase [Nocardia sp. NPDC052112]|uniref:lytic transglycosylase domain-containing protein n=1 Tax=Nocardia sp. NPDC052112 TaxID=3155646 RepID=UPI003412A090
MRSHRRAHPEPPNQRSGSLSSRPAFLPMLTVAGLLVAGSSTLTATPDVLQTANHAAAQALPVDNDATVGLLPVLGNPSRRLRAVSAEPEVAASAARPSGATDVGATPVSTTAVGIPEAALAAYRNAELALAHSAPGCGLTWSLLAGIGRIESGHARGGDLDASGTARSPILGPLLDGTLPGNEIIRDAKGYVRAIGPMQFLPATWTRYASDGNADGVTDPENVFDAALAAGRYLCSGGMDLRDPTQELKAVLRYNNSPTYAADVLSWAASYRGSGARTIVTVDLPPVGSGQQESAGSDPTPPPLDNAHSDSDPGSESVDRPAVPSQAEPMIQIPGLPPIPCGILCPPTPGTTVPQTNTDDPHTS